MITVINYDRMKRCCDLETPTWVKKKQKEVIDGAANLVLVIWKYSVSVEKGIMDRS